MQGECDDEIMHTPLSVTVLLPSYAVNAASRDPTFSPPTWRKQLCCCAFNFTCLEISTNRGVSGRGCNPNKPRFFALFRNVSVEVPSQQVDVFTLGPSVISNRSCSALFVMWNCFPFTSSNVSDVFEVDAKMYRLGAAEMPIQLMSCKINKGNYYSVRPAKLSIRATT